MDLNKLIPESTKYIILDFDATIAKTKHIWPEVNRRWFEMFNVNDDVNEFDKEAQNMTMEASCELLLRRNPQLKQSVKELSVGASKICDEVAAECEFVPGADIFIKKAHKKQIELCIATNSPISFVKAFFSTKEKIFSQLFDSHNIFSGSDTKLHKSNPQFYLDAFTKCFNKQESDFKDVVIAEDSLYAIESSSQLKSKGAYILAIEDKNDGRRELADKVVQNFLI